MEVIVLFVLFFLKHLIVDFFLQGPFEYLNKGTLWHWGGIRHSLKHAGVTFAILLLAVPFNFALFLAVSVLEFVMHYVIDYCKVGITRNLGLDANKHKEFWWLLGIDQWLHNLTYALIIMLVIL